MQGLTLFDEELGEPPCPICGADADEFITRDEYREHRRWCGIEILEDG